MPIPPSPIDDASFKAAMSHFASGVTIVTTEHEGQQYGMTVASFASLSLHPPLVLVCVEKSVKTHDAISSAGTFGVSILDRQQAQVSGRLAAKIGDQVTGVEVVRGGPGVPVIRGAVCAVACKVPAAFPGG